MQKSIRSEIGRALELLGGDRQLSGTASSSEIYTALERLGADRQLLVTVGSWGDTLDDRDVLQLLQRWNQEEEKFRQK